MKILITGAGGYLGAETVERALAAGHAVVALSRRSTVAARHPHLTIVREDLSRPIELDRALQGVDLVIHLAAEKSGDFDAQFSGTILGTENLLAAMQRNKTAKLILVSSFAVYDYDRLRRNATLSEASALLGPFLTVGETPLSKIRHQYSERDAYAITKRMQEELIAEFASATGANVAIVRPGVIYCEKNGWNSRLGVELSSRVRLRISSPLRLPIVHVRDCARFLLHCAETNAAGFFNLCEPRQPRQNEYWRALRPAANPPVRELFLPYWLLRTAALALRWISRRFIGGRLQTPRMLTPASLAARFKPLRFDVARAVAESQFKFENSLFLQTRS